MFLCLIAQTDFTSGPTSPEDARDRGENRSPSPSQDHQYDTCDDLGLPPPAPLFPEHSSSEEDNSTNVSLRPDNIIDSQVIDKRTSDSPKESGEAEKIDSNNQDISSKIMGKVNSNITLKCFFLIQLYILILL